MFFVNHLHWVSQSDY